MFREFLDNRRAAAAGIYNPLERQKALIAIGLGVDANSYHMTADGRDGPKTRNAVLRLQQGWAPPAGSGYPRLQGDGIYGKLTDGALKLAQLTGGHLSPHLRFREFACPHCGFVNVKAGLADALEVYRLRIVNGGNPNGTGGLAIVSGTRCPTHNRDVGGAGDSVHLDGGAADVVQIVSVSPVRSLRRFSGLEISSRKLIVHVDVRHLTRRTAFTPDNPSIFTWPTTLLPEQAASQIGCYS